MKRYIKAAVADLATANYDTKAQVAKDPNTRPEILASLVNDRDWCIREELADNPSTPLDALNQLSRDKNTAVRKAVASNPSTGYDILDKLSLDYDEWVRANVARHHNTSPDTLNRIARGDCSLARYWAACNPHTSRSALEWLRKYSGNSAVMDAAARTLDNPNWAEEALF